MENKYSVSYLMTGPRDESFGAMVNRAARLFARQVDRELKDIGVWSGMLPVFFALCDGQSMSQKALAEYAAIEQATMANTLTRMVREGFIERRTDPADRRSQLISLTPDAMTKAGEVRERTFGINQVVVQELDEAERVLFHALLRKVIGALEKHSSENG